MLEVDNATFSRFIVMLEHDATMIDDLLIATTKEFPYHEPKRSILQGATIFTCQGLMML